LEEIASEISHEDSESLGELIDAFLQKQPKINAIIFVRRYYYSEPVKDIAEKMGITENKASKILAKLRKSLREDLRKGGIHI
jgi:RNA polymerase sigma-70 factor (ECF subfamily)